MEISIEVIIEVVVKLMLQYFNMEVIDICKSNFIQHESLHITSSLGKR